MKQKKIALVLSGGGFKGSFQLGAIQWLQQPENWKRATGLDTPMHFDIIAGVSVGALNGIMLAMKKYEVMNQLWDEVKANGGFSIYESDFIDGRGNIKLNVQVLKERLLPNFKLTLKHGWSYLFNRKKFFKQLEEMIDSDLKTTLPKFRSLATNNALLKKLNSHVAMEKIPENTLYMCGFVSIYDGKYYKLTSKDFANNEQFCKAILASSAMPIVWDTVDEVHYKNNSAPTKAEQLLDGGLRNISPLGDVIDVINEDTNADYQILVINTSSGEIDIQKKEWNIATIALRTLTDITLEEIFDNDIYTFETINQLVDQAEAKGFTLIKPGTEQAPVTLRKFKCQIINPDRNVLGGALDTDPAILERSRKHGWEKAEERLADKTLLLV
jgi:NTE family protein